MKVSLILCTRNRSGLVEELLTSIAGQTYLDFEILVIDQSDSPHLERNATIVAAASSSLSIVHVETQTRGLSVGRNLGLSMVNGEVVGFPDDDCVYNTDTLERVIEAFSENGELDGVCGQYLPRGSLVSRFPVKPLDIGIATAFRTVSSIGLFVKADAIKKLGVFFSPDMGVGTAWPLGEEVDFVIQLLKRSAQLRYDPKIRLMHEYKMFEVMSPIQIGRLEGGHGYLLGRHLDSITIAVKVAGGVLQLLFSGRLMRLTHRLTGIVAGIRSR